MDYLLYQEIGNRMAQVRRSNNVTQEVLAEWLDVSPKHISHTERGTSSLSLKNLMEFCAIFHCSLDYIVFGQLNNETLNKLPSKIIELLNSGNKEDIQLLQEYLDLFLKLRKNQD